MLNGADPVGGGHPPGAFGALGTGLSDFSKFLRTISNNFL